MDQQQKLAKMTMANKNIKSNAQPRSAAYLTENNNELTLTLINESVTTENGVKYYEFGVMSVVKNHQC
jgi:hypothetical protein